MSDDYVPIKHRVMRLLVGCALIAGVALAIRLFMWGMGAYAEFANW